MTEPTQICPDCGHPNPRGAESCEHCNFPLVPPAEAATPAAGAPEPAASRRATGPGRVPADPSIPRPLGHRRRPPRSTMDQQALSLWLFVGGFCVLLLLYFAVSANVKRQQPAVEGSNTQQQQAANLARAAIAQDSTNVAARVALADVLYDTGNWSEAIIHYRSAVAHDSSQVMALVDLGVCYYNLSEANEAQRLFRLALARDPHQPVAWFNLGILAEHREEYDEALRYYHSAMQSAPPENMQQPLADAVKRIAEKTGRKPGPLPGGTR